MSFKYSNKHNPKHVTCYLLNKRWNCVENLSIMNAEKIAKTMYGEYNYKSVELLEQPVEFSQIDIILYGPKFEKPDPLVL